MDILAVVGMRPEAIKMAPVIMALRDSKQFATKLCLSGQHRHIVDSVLQLFSITADFDLDVMQPDQSLD
jgi:UDP-N-acetylglucosamine 2-epimerase (non-hydrolysing)